MYFLILTLSSIFILSACVSSETTTMLNTPVAQKQTFDPVAAADTRIKLALLYLQNKQMQLAKENLDTALGYQPNDAKIYRVYAYYFQQVNETDKAEAFYKKSLYLDDSNGDTYNNYGTFLCALERYDEAEAAFLEAINSKNYAKIARSYANAAICAEKGGFNQKAIHYYESALSYSPNSYELYLSLAKLNITEKHYKAAETNLFMFQKHSTVTAESLWEWMRLSYASGNKASFTRYSEQLLEQFPESQQALNYLNNGYYD
ncbi:type IV pilus biogenesis/stability protein PilW [Psychromonas aquatilis]|uniref:Type IV pilus biogenesis/stability protein PilW n=1 Tax=Psychromonas aquatilis TaxID=2005072 RepID=A0ABU9GRG1_9GAMM